MTTTPVDIETGNTRPKPTALPTFNPERWEENIHPAGDWVLDAKAQSRAVMGRDDKIVWAEQESFIIVGDTGFGKSTLAQNIVKTSIGLQNDVLGHTVREFKRILYIAADRPSQIKYSLSRMVTEQTRARWNECVHVHEGPLDFAINEKPDLLSTFAKMSRERWGSLSCDCIVIDSLKDITSAISDDDDGIKINKALQAVTREGVELMITHHPRKMSNDRWKKGDAPLPTLDDVYGSKFITAGAGSVLFLYNSQPEGVNVSHVKSPAGEVVFPRVAFDGPTGQAYWG